MPRIYLEQHGAGGYERLQHGGVGAGEVVGPDEREGGVASGEACPSEAAAEAAGGANHQYPAPRPRRRRRHRRPLDEIRGAIVDGRQESDGPTGVIHHIWAIKRENQAQYYVIACYRPSPTGCNFTRATAAAAPTLSSAICIDHRERRAGRERRLDEDASDQEGEEAWRQPGGFTGR